MSDTEVDGAVTFKKRRLKKSKVLSEVNKDPSHDDDVSEQQQEGRGLNISQLDQTSHTVHKKQRIGEPDAPSSSSTTVSLAQGSTEGKGINFTVTSNYDANADQSRKTYQVTASLADEPIQKNTFNKAIPRGLLSQQQQQNAYARGTSTVDYALDICKDYKLYGWCAWGDSCKFLHHRGEHKSSSQLDREWQRKQEERSDPSQGQDDDGANNKDAVPTTCGICHGPFLAQIVMAPCHHFFCETCANNTLTATSDCPVCGKPTQGRLINARREIERRKALLLTIERSNDISTSI